MAQLFANVGISRLAGVLGRKKCDMANGIYLLLAAGISYFIPEDLYLQFRIQISLGMQKTSKLVIQQVLLFRRF